MASFEQVERLREKANVTFEEAKEALDAAGGDLLDALIYLERQGKVAPPTSGGGYSSSEKDDRDGASENCHSQAGRGESFGELLRRFGKFCAKLINKGNNNFFEAEKNGKTIISCPVTAVVVLLLFFFWVVVPLIIVGLFFGFRYSFRGNDLGKESINRVMDNASNTAEEIKKSVAGDGK